MILDTINRLQVLYWRMHKQPNTRHWGIWHQFTSVSNKMGCVEAPATIFLTHRDRNKMTAIIQTTFSNGFSLMKMYEFRLKFHWIVPMVPTNNITALVGAKRLSEPMMISLLMQIHVTRPHWVDTKVRMTDVAGLLSICRRNKQNVIKRTYVNTCCYTVSSADVLLSIYSETSVYLCIGMCSR